MDLPDAVGAIRHPMEASGLRPDDLIPFIQGSKVGLLSPEESG